MHKEKTSRPAGIFGVPLDLGQDRRGVDMGPSAIRYARLQDTLEDLGCAVEDLGNADTPIPEVADADEENSQGARHLGAVRDVCSAVASRAKEMASGGMFPIFLGGDHSISIGTISGIAAASPRRTGVIWLDAHADFNTPETSPTGNIHGMPLAVLAGQGHTDLVSIGGEGASIPVENIVLIGIRSVDRQEQALLRESGVHAFTMKDIDSQGVASVVREAMDRLMHLDNVHLSFDLDVVDPDMAPGVGTPVRGGLTYREAHLIMELINEAGLVTSLDVVEVNPILDSKNGTAQLAVELVASLMGRRIMDLPRQTFEK